MGATLYPADLRRNAIEDAVRPFPMPEMTPPETKMNFVFLVDEFLSGTIYYIRGGKNSQPFRDFRNRFSFGHSSALQQMPPFLESAFFPFYPRFLCSQKASH